MAERHVSGDRLSAFLDDELTEHDARNATRHLTDCDRCVGELSALRSTRDALRALPTLQAPVLSSGPRARRPRIGHNIRFVLGACAVPVLLGAGIYVLGGEGGEGGEVEPTTELFLMEHLGRTGGGPVPTAAGGAAR